MFYKIYDFEIGELAICEENGKIVLVNVVKTKEDIEEIKSAIPLNRIGSPLSIAKCVKWLIEDDYTTGEVISINGGWHM